MKQVGKSSAIKEANIDYASIGILHKLHALAIVQQEPLLVQEPFAEMMDGAVTLVKPNVGDHYFFVYRKDEDSGFAGCEEEFIAHAIKVGLTSIPGMVETLKKRKNQ